MSQAKIALVAFVWLFLLGMGVVIWKLVLQPQQQAEVAQQRSQQEKQAIDATQGTSRYRHDLYCGLDSFSGYAVLRSPEFTEQLNRVGIRVNLSDDRADYAKRMDRLEAGEVQFAAFPIDALLKVCSQRQRLPATIIALLDETVGADAMLAYKQQFPDLDSLNTAQTRIVLVGESPSETLTRLVVRDFDLSDLNGQAIQAVDSPEKLMGIYRQAKPSGHEVFVTWEPFVSQLLENDQVHVLVDSSKFSGYIVDALVVNRDFLLKQPSVVEDFLACYFRALSTFREPFKQVELFLADAKQTGSALTPAQAERLRQGVRLKNTQENYSHFGLRPDQQLLHVEDILLRISRVLVESNVMAQDPTQGQFSKLFYDKALAKLKSDNFLPSEAIRQENQLSALTESQWAELIPVGTLKVPELVFARGTATLTPSSKQTLDELADKLQSWPAYYLQVEGNAASGGNAQANLSLAARRADAAVEYLRGLGVPEARLRAASGKVGQSRVVFVLSELPY